MIDMILLNFNVFINKIEFMDSIPIDLSIIVQEYNVLYRKLVTILMWYKFRPLQI